MRQVVFLTVLCLPVMAQPNVRATLDRYCVGCHNAKARAGALALDSESEIGGLHWERVMRRLRARSMPPVGMPRPDEATYRATLASIESKLDADFAAKPNPGRTDTFRRLNRTEYHNAIRDLLALEVDVNALLPSDDASHGFDNVTVGDLSPTLLERYLNAARRISRIAIGIPGKAPGGDTVQAPPDLTQEKHLPGMPLGTRGGLAFPFVFPVDGEYEISVRLARDRNEHIEGLRGKQEVLVLLDGEPLQSFVVAPPPIGKDHQLVDAHLKVKLNVKAGPKTVTATFPRKAFPVIETERQPYEAHFNFYRHPRLLPAVYSVTVNGPFAVQGPGSSPSRKRLMVCAPESAADEEPCARKIVAGLARSAYRRPVTEKDLAPAMRFFREGRAAGGFDNGVELALRSVLVSPDFLFRVEQDQGPGVYRISDLELATRLSFFLWSSIPDEELLRTAEKGTLRQPAELERQVKRMLADGRARSLVTNFAGQWLYLRNLQQALPDMRLFTDFDDNLRKAFQTETELFFESIMKEDRSVMDLLRANYTFVNERLAKHYGIPNVYGSRFRRVELPAGSNRGGLLRQGSILTVTSYATRTSPVIRGKWILDNLLGVPPPAPPPNVPALKEGVIGNNLTMRERLAEHRRNPACAGCHNLMDPVGFAMENYDATGRYRTAEEGGKAIDNSGGLPDGSKFNGVEGLEEALLKYKDMFAGTLAEKLMTYGLGRGMEHYDGPAVRKVVAGAKPRNYAFSSFIMGVVRSTPFQMRRGQ